MAKQAQEKMIDIISHHENAKQNHDGYLAA